MENSDIAYGVHAVTEAFMSMLRDKLYIQEDLRGKNVDKTEGPQQLRKCRFLDTKENLQE